MGWQSYTVKLENNNLETLFKVANIIQEIEPNAIKALPYGVPGFKYKNKNLIGIAPMKNHFGVYPMSSNVVNVILKKHPEVSGANGTFRFAYDNLPNKKLLKEIIDARKEEIDNI